MDVAALLDLLDRPIAVHPVFIKLAGSHTGGVMLSQAFYWTRIMQKKRGVRFDGWFYKSREEWEEETLLKRREQENARKLLRATGFWLEERRDNPARLYYRIDLEAFSAAIIGQSAVPTRRDDPYHQETADEGTIRTTEIAPNVPSPRAPLSDQTESTTESTPVRGKPRVKGSFDEANDKSPKYGIEMIRMLPDDWLAEQRAKMLGKFPTLNFDQVHDQWCLSRFRDGGIGRRGLHTVTLLQYAADLAIFFANWHERRQNGNSNGYGYGAGKVDAQSASRFVAGPVNQAVKDEQARVAAEYDENIRRMEARRNGHR